MDIVHLIIPKEMKLDRTFKEHKNSTLSCVHAHTHTHIHTRNQKNLGRSCYVRITKKAMEYSKVELSFTEYSWTETIVTAMLSGNTESE